MSNVRTVSDTKRAFYGTHTRPINAIYRRVVEELMVETHLLLVNIDFTYDAIYALGVVSLYDRFMMGYQPDADKDSIYLAIIQAVGADPNQYRRDAEEVLAAAKNVPSVEAFKALLTAAQGSGDGDTLKGNLHKVISNPKFKYSRLFTTGLYNVIEVIDPGVLQDKEKREALLNEVAEILGFNSELLLKDVELYRGNLEKMAQAQEVMKDMVEAEKKKKAKREQERLDKANSKDIAPTDPTDPTKPTDTDVAESAESTAE